MKNNCLIVGFVSLLIYTILTAMGTNQYPLKLRIFFAGVAAVAFAIRMIIEIFNKENFEDSIIAVVWCLLDIVFSVLYT